MTPQLQSAGTGCGAIPSASSGDLPVALERIDRFVARTQNWFYDHLRVVPRHRPVVICSSLENRDEFPDLEALHLDRDHLGRRLWYRLQRDRLYPPDARRLRAFNAVAFHSHLGYVAVGDFNFVDALELPWLVSFYGADVYLFSRDPKWTERYAPLFARASRILSLGPAMSAGLERLGCPRDKIAIHPLGVDVSGLPQRPRVRAPGVALKILFCATFREKKGGVYLLDAVGQLRSRGVPLELHLVGDAAGRPGDAETKAELFRRVEALGLASVTTHHGWLPFRELIDLALGCHVFVAPSVTAADGDAEGSPFVMAQMMATGMPVVATRHSDIPFTFGKYANRLVPERDAGAIAERLQRYFDEPATLTQEGLDLRALMLQTFDTRICAERLSGHYDALTSVSGA